MTKSIIALEDRLIHFAAAVLKLVNKMPKDPGAQHLAERLLRSGTSPGLRYAETEETASRPELRQQAQVVQQELRETHNGLKIIQLMNYVDAPSIDRVLRESKELVGIFTATLRGLEAEKA